MDNSYQKATVTAQSVLEKIKSLSAKSSKNFIDTPKSINENFNSEELLSNISTNPSSESSFLIILRYISIVCLVILLIITILNTLDMLPISLGNIFSFSRISKKSRNKENEENEDSEPHIATAIDNNTKNDKSYNIPEIKKIAQRPEVSAPTRLPQVGNPLPTPDITGSKTQAVQATKSGFCYIGEDRGFRSCVPVKSGNQCMSGDIFPTQAICINPNLRA